MASTSPRNNSIDWKLVDAKLAVADTPEAKQHRDELFRELDTNNNLALSLSEVQSGLGKVLENPNKFRRVGQTATGLIPGMNEFKLPIKAAFKNAKQLNISAAGDNSTVDRQEFHALLVYFRNYLELLVLFKNLDSTRDMMLSAQEIVPYIQTLEKWGITADKMKSKLKMEPKEEMAFERFADWCLLDKLKGMTFDANEGVKQAKPSSAQPTKAQSPLQETIRPSMAVSSRTFSSRERQAIIRAKTEQKNKKMRALEREYRQTLDKIAQQGSALKLPDNCLPSFGARVETSTKNGRKKMALSDAEYKTWLLQRTVSQDGRINQMISERAVSIVDMRAKVKAQRQQQRATEVEEGFHGLLHGVPDGKLPRQSRSRSEPQLPGSYLTEEEKQEVIEKLRNPIWDKSLAERAAAERKYWKWAASVKQHAQCAVDHHFTGPRGGQTDVQCKLIEKAAAEKEYWKWASSLKFSKSCATDQAWTTM